MPEWEPPTLTDVLDARRRIAPHLSATPLYGYPALDDLVGTTVLVKHENHQPVGAFKVRGGINLVSQLSAEERQHGVFAASTGNHGQSIAYASRLFGVSATICAPEGANPVKVASMRGLGAEVVLGGCDFDEARERCDELARERRRGRHSKADAADRRRGTESLRARAGPHRRRPSRSAESGAKASVVAGRRQRCGRRRQSEAAPPAYRSWKGGAPSRQGPRSPRASPPGAVRAPQRRSSSATSRLRLGLRRRDPGRPAPPIGRRATDRGRRRGASRRRATAAAGAAGSASVSWRQRHEPASSSLFATPKKPRRRLRCLVIDAQAGTGSRLRQAERLPDGCRTQYRAIGRSSAPQ